jgi:hypothetical protein
MPYNCSGELVCFVTQMCNVYVPQAATSRVFAFPFRRTFFSRGFQPATCFYPSSQGFVSSYTEYTNEVLEPSFEFVSNNNVSCDG